MTDKSEIDYPMSWQAVSTAQLQEILKLTPGQRLQLLEEIILFHRSVRKPGQATTAPNEPAIKNS